MRPTRLQHRTKTNSGNDIYAFVPQMNFVECTTKEGYQPILEGVVGYEPWTQFPPKEYSDMIEEVFKEMVDLWNEKYGEPIKTTGK